MGSVEAPGTVRQIVTDKLCHEFFGIVPVGRAICHNRRMSLATRMTIVVIALATAAWSGLVIGRVTMEPPVTPVASSPIVLTKIAVQTTNIGSAKARDFSVRAKATKKDKAAKSASTHKTSHTKVGQTSNAPSQQRKATHHNTTRASTGAQKSTNGSSRPKNNVSAAPRPVAARPSTAKTTYKRVTAQVQATAPLKRTVTNTTSHVKKAAKKIKKAKKSKPSHPHRR